MSRLRSRVIVASFATAALALALAGCGKSAKDNGTSTTETTEKSGGKLELTELGKKLPKDVQEAGKITVCSDIAYAPVEFYKEGTKEVEGIDPDIAAAMGKELGIEFVFENTTFDGIIPALKAKRCDIIMSAMTDNLERQKEVDFIDYFNAGTSIIVKKGNPEKIESLDDLCGKKIGIQKGTTQEDVAKAQAEKCEKSGKTLTVDTFEQDTEALQQLELGRTAADMNDFPVAAYNAKQKPDKFEVVGEQIEAGPYGIAVLKTNTELRDVLQEALHMAIESGAYDAVLEKWNVTQGEEKTATINGGKS